MEQLSFDEQSMQLGRERIEGILTSLTIDNVVRFDSQTIDGISGKKKIPQGFEDSCITATFVLLNEEKSTAYAKLRSIQKLFTGVDSKANPQIFEVFHPHLEARHIRQVVFNRLVSSENESNDTIEVSLSFTEHNPPVVEFEIRQSISPATQALAEIAKKAITNAIKKNPVLGDFL